MDLTGKGTDQVLKCLKSEVLIVIKMGLILTMMEDYFTLEVLGT